MQPLSRRSFAARSLRWSAAILAGGVIGSSARTLRAEPAKSPDTKPELPERLFNWQRLSPSGADQEPGAAVFACLPPSAELATTGGNGLLVIGKGVALLIDTKYAALGPTLRNEARDIAAEHGAQLTHVVNTHHHADHTGGNHSFAGDVTLLAHEKALPRILDENQFKRYRDGVDGTVALVGKSKLPGIDAVLNDAAKVKADFESGALTAQSFAPNKTVSRDTSLDIGGVEVWLRHFGPAHTDNDIVVHLPTLNLLHTGDLVFNKLHPYMDGSAGSSSTSWQKALSDCVLLCDDKTIVIPGHGELTDRVGVLMQSQYFTKLREIVRHAKDVDGMTRDEAMKLKTGAFEGYGFDRMLPNSIGVIYDELSK